MSDYDTTLIYHILAYNTIRVVPWFWLRVQTLSLFENFTDYVT